MKVSDLIAEFLVKKNIRYVFGIIGAGNAHLFDAIYRRGFTEIICVHHEQAACMAMQTYYRTSGIITAAILTTGAGSSNGVTGVVSAWADSIPGLIISGNENSKYLQTDRELRMWGVQGYDSTQMVKEVTKYSKRVTEAADVEFELEKAYSIAQKGRPGPCWLDIPMNIQSQTLIPDESKSEVYVEDKVSPNKDSIAGQTGKVVLALQKAKRPLIWLGHGIRLADADQLIEPLLDQMPIPALVSWAGIDLIDSYHPLVFGRAGVYGQRCANFILQNCDFLLCVGTRLAIPQVGYDIQEFARDAEIAVVDIDEHELAKYKQRIQFPIKADAKDFLTELMQQSTSFQNPHLAAWTDRCNQYRQQYPWVTDTDHPDEDGFMNSYRFMEKLNSHLKEDQIIVTDMGTALLSGHQVLRMRKGQRLMTSTGLGEMGYGLPGAIGASFATNKGEVMCLNCDGGMMLNLQELQTMVHHQLPIKLFIFNNDGYLMIKHTQKALFDGRNTGTDKASGVTCPDFSAVAKAFNIPSYQIRTWIDFETIIPEVQAYDGPLICEVFMHPHQLFVPKLSLAVQKDGSLVSPPLEDLSPFLNRSELSEAMLIGVHPKSEMIQV